MRADVSQGSRAHIASSGPKRFSAIGAEKCGAGVARVWLGCGAGVRRRTRPSATVGVAIGTSARANAPAKAPCAIAWPLKRRGAACVSRRSRVGSFPVRPVAGPVGVERWFAEKRLDVSHEASGFFARQAARRSPTGPPPPAPSESGRRTRLVRLYAKRSAPAPKNLIRLQYQSPQSPPAALGLGDAAG